MDRVRPETDGAAPIPGYADPAPSPGTVTGRGDVTGNYTRASGLEGSLGGVGFEKLGARATAGIPPATGGALHVLQFDDARAADAQSRSAMSFASSVTDRVVRAAGEVARYHAPTKAQAEAHERVSDALGYFLSVIVANCPPGPERSTAISRAREAKMWASAAVAMEGH